jgi:hypothetical protein
LEAKLLKKQQKKGRPRLENPMDIGLSTEIRQRLLVYEQDRDLAAFQNRDHQTQNLIEAIKSLANNLDGDLGKRWHEHAYALAAFKAGVAAFLAQYKPEGDASKRPDTRVVGEPDDPPETVGRTHARLIWIAMHG